MKALLIDFSIFIKYGGNAKYLEDISVSSGSNISSIEWANEFKKNNISIKDNISFDINRGKMKQIKDIITNTRYMYTVDSIKDSYKIINNNIECFSSNYITLFTDKYNNESVKFDEANNIIIERESIMDFYRKYMNMNTKITPNSEEIYKDYDIVILAKSESLTPPVYDNEYEYLKELTNINEHYNNSISRKDIFKDKIS